MVTYSAVIPRYIYSVFFFPYRLLPIYFLIFLCVCINVELFILKYFNLVGICDFFTIVCNKIYEIYFMLIAGQTQS